MSDLILYFTYISSGGGAVCSGKPAAPASHPGSWRRCRPVPAGQPRQVAAHLPAQAATLTLEACCDNGRGQATQNWFCGTFLQEVLPYRLPAAGEPLQLHAG